MTEPMEPDEMVIKLLAQFFLGTKLERQREIIFTHVKAIRIKQAEKAFAQMEAAGGRPYIHFTERQR